MLKLAIFFFFAFAMPRAEAYVTTEKYLELLEGSADEKLLALSYGSGMHDTAIAMNAISESKGTPIFCGVSKSSKDPTLIANEIKNEAAREPRALKQAVVFVYATSLAIQFRCD